MRVSRLVVRALVALVVGAVVATGAVTADAGRCDLWDGDLFVDDGECYYTNDAKGAISVQIMNGGTVNGGSGDDTVSLMTGGTFNGGDGDDAVMRSMDGGTFNGGAGYDSVTNLDGPTAVFNGGTGNDAVFNYHLVDTAFSQGTFNGGPGIDVVAGRMDGTGTFNGGPGDDAVVYYCSGTVWSADYDPDTCNLP